MVWKVPNAKVTKRSSKDCRILEVGEEFGNIDGPTRIFRGRRESSTSSSEKRQSVGFGDLLPAIPKPTGRWWRNLSEIPSCALRALPRPMFAIDCL